MSDDGAHDNLPADRALQAVLGGVEDGAVSDEQFAAMIRRADRNGPITYATCCSVFARMALETLEADPATRTLNTYELYKAVKARSAEDAKWLEGQGLTGFMVGWGVNAARKVLALSELPNPALMTFVVSE